MCVSYDTWYIRSLDIVVSFLLLIVSLFFVGYRVESFGISKYQTSIHRSIKYRLLNISYRTSFCILPQLPDTVRTSARAGELPRKCPYKNDYFLTGVQRVLWRHCCCDVGLRPGKLVLTRISAKIREASFRRVNTCVASPTKTVFFFFLHFR